LGGDEATVRAGVGTAAGRGRDAAQTPPESVRHWRGSGDGRGRIEEAVDTDVFDAYVTECLGPTLREGDVVVLDNLKVHHASRIPRVANERRATVMWPPAYSPDFNPIERLWSKMKALIRAAKATTREELDAALKRALAAVSQKDIAGWFTHCGYPLEVAGN
jgi:transposase